MATDSSGPVDDIEDVILEGDQEPTEGSEEAAPEEGSPAEKELATLKKRFRDTQRKLHEVSTERAQLLGKLEGVTLRDGKPNESPTNPFDGMDESEVIANPNLIVERAKTAHASLVSELGQVLRTMQEELRKEIRQQNPERLELKELIDELREDPDLADLDDEVLIRLARREKRSPQRVRTLAGGARRGSSGGDVRKSGLFQAIYGDRFAEETK
jgi:hypothetical protein